MSHKNQPNVGKYICHIGDKILGGGNSNIFWIFTPKNWGRLIQFDYSNIFQMGGSTTNYIEQYYRMFQRVEYEWIFHLMGGQFWKCLSMKPCRYWCLVQVILRCSHIQWLHIIYKAIPIRFWSTKKHYPKNMAKIWMPRRKHLYTIGSNSLRRNCGKNRRWGETRKHSARFLRFPLKKNTRRFQGQMEHHDKKAVHEGAGMPNDLGLS